MMTAYLSGVIIGEPTFQRKSADMKAELEDVQRNLDEAAFDPTHGEAALAVYDFSQKLPEIWQGANRTVRRDLLDCVSLNRHLSDISLVTQKRKPFDSLVKRPSISSSRGEKRP